MGKDLTSGTWFDIKTERDFDQILRYGRLDNTFYRARVQRGGWEGPGQYNLLQYTQRCPRNCCDDTVNELLSKRVFDALANEKIDWLAREVHKDCVPVLFPASYDEFDVLDDLSRRMDLSHASILRQALRVYQGVLDGVI